MRVSRDSGILLFLGAFKMEVLEGFQRFWYPPLLGGAQTVVFGKVSKDSGIRPFLEAFEMEVFGRFPGILVSPLPLLEGGPRGGEGSENGGFWMVSKDSGLLPLSGRPKRKFWMVFKDSGLPPSLGPAGNWIPAPRIPPVEFYHGRSGKSAQTAISKGPPLSGPSLGFPGSRNREKCGFQQFQASK